MEYEYLKLLKVFKINLGKQKMGNVLFWWGFISLIGVSMSSMSQSSRIIFTVINIITILLTIPHELLIFPKF
jgi:hypothetical protein